MSGLFLLVEDNIGDVVLFQHALEKVDPSIRLQVAEDGITALAFLSAFETEAKPGIPDLILLDLNLPRMSGAEVILKIHKNPILSLIPLVVLTSSQHERDVLGSWDPRRCLYLVKPSTFQELVDLVRQIVAFLATVPPPKQA